MAALLLPFPFIAVYFAGGDPSVAVYSFLAAELAGFFAIAIGRAGLRDTTTTPVAPSGGGAAVSRLMSGGGMPAANRGSSVASAPREGRSEAITGIALGAMGMAIWGVWLIAFVATAGSGGPRRAEPSTPEQLAVTKTIGALFSALAADDAALACKQLTPGARTASTPVLRGSVGGLRCRGKPAYRWTPSARNLPKNKVYNVSITGGDWAEAEVPFRSDPFSNGLDFRLVRVGGRWLIVGASVYTYVGG